MFSLQSEGTEQFTFDPTGRGTDQRHTRTISDSNKMGEAASLRGGFCLLLLFGDELSFLQRQIHLLLRVVVVELADVGDQGPAEGTDRALALSHNHASLRKG